MGHKYGMTTNVGGMGDILSLMFLTLNSNIPPNHLACSLSSVLIKYYVHNFVTKKMMPSVNDSDTNLTLRELQITKFPNIC